MENLVPLGTGNSRLMKSNIPSNTTLAQLIQMWNNGTFPYDIGPLNSAGISQQGTPLNKDTLLKDATAALFGLGSDAVPDDVLAWIGKYNQYWWRRRINQDTESSYVETQSTATNNYTPPGGSNGYLYLTGDVNWSTTTSIYYSENINIDQNDGSVSLLDRKTARVSPSDPKESTLRGKYISNAYNATNNIYYVAEDADINNYPLDEDYYVVIPLSDVKIVGSEIYTGHYTGPWEYLYSSDQGTYPDSGIVDSYEYQYLGIPFENAREAPKIATGSYVGTGMYGAGNPNTLTFEFEPKIVIISVELDTTSQNNRSIASFVMIRGQTSSIPEFAGSNRQANTVAFNENTVQWYNASNQGAQLNTAPSGSIIKAYYYIAIG